MEHFITQVKIEKLRHLENIEVNLATDNRRHLLLIGKNGSGKTSVLEALHQRLSAIKVTSRQNLYLFDKLTEKNITSDWKFSLIMMKA